MLPFTCCSRSRNDCCNCQCYLAIGETSAAAQFEFLDLETLIKDILLAESCLWKDGIICDLNESLRRDDKANMIHFQIWKAAFVLEKVHNYFRELDPRSCCTLLTHTRPVVIATSQAVQFYPVNPLFERLTGATRLPLEDDAIIAGASVYQFPLEWQSASDTKVHRGSFDNHFDVLKLAVRCADYPLLSGTGLQLDTDDNESTNSSANPPTPELSSVDCSLMTSERLREHLRYAFGLYNDEFEALSRSAYQSRGDRKSVVLAEDLALMLRALETNTHPYYSPREFELREAYENWKQEQRARILYMKEQFWPREALPLLRGKDIRYYSPHCEYRKLLRFLITYDLSTRGAQLNRDTDSMLSAASVRLLCEFQRRYGLLDIWTLICQVECFTELFDIQIAMLQQLWYTVKRLQVLLCDVTPPFRLALKSEKVKLMHTLGLLEKKVRQAIQRGTRAFHSTEERHLGMSLFVKILSRVHKLQDVCSAQSTSINTGEVLRQLLARSCELVYESHKLKEVPDSVSLLSKIGRGLPLSPQLIGALVVKVEEHVREYVVCYSTIMERWLDVRQVTACSFYKALKVDVLKLFDYELKESQRKPKLWNRRHFMFLLGMSSRLGKLDKNWLDVIGRECLPWRQRYIQLLINSIPRLRLIGKNSLRQALRLCNFSICELNETQESANIASRYTTYQQSTNSAFSNVLGRTTRPVTSEECGVVQSAGSGSGTRPSASAVRRTQSDSTLYTSRHSASLMAPSCTDMLFCSELGPATEHEDEDPSTDSSSHSEQSEVLQSVCSLFAQSVCTRPSASAARRRTQSDSSLCASRHSASLVAPCGTDMFSCFERAEHTERGPATDHEDEDSSSDFSSHSEQHQVNIVERRLIRRSLFRDSALLLDLFCLCARWRDLFVHLREACSLDPRQLNVVQRGRSMSDAIEHEGAESSAESAATDQLYYSQTKEELLVLHDLDVKLCNLVNVRELHFVRIVLNQLVWMDVCGTSLAAGRACYGHDELERLLRVVKSGNTWSCRHKAATSASGKYQSCSQFFGANRASSTLAGRHESVTHDMCVRLNAIYCLTRLLPCWFSLMPANISVAHCQEATSQVDGGAAKSELECRRQAQTAFHGGVKLMAARLSVFVSDALRLTLQDLSGQMDPLVAFVSKYLRRLKLWLKPACFAAVMLEWWSCVLCALEKQCNSLWRRNAAAQHLATHLFDILNHLLFIFYRAGASLDELMGSFGGPQDVCVERLFLKLDLYSWESRLLLGTYLHTVLRTRSSYSHTLPDSYLIKAARYLHSSRKVFSGADLVDYLVKWPPPDNEYEEEEQTFWQIMDKERAICLAQNLLDCKALLPLSFEAATAATVDDSRRLSSPVPEMREVFEISAGSSSTAASGLIVNSPSGLHLFSERSDSSSPNIDVFRNSRHVFYRLAIANHLFDEAIEEDLFEDNWDRISEALRNNRALLQLGSQLKAHQLPIHWPLRVLYARREQDLFSRRMLRRVSFDFKRNDSCNLPTAHHEMEDVQVVGAKVQICDSRKLRICCLTSL